MAAWRVGYQPRRVCCVICGREFLGEHWLNRHVFEMELPLFYRALRARYISVKKQSGDVAQLRFEPWQTMIFPKTRSIGNS